MKAVHQASTIPGSLSAVRSNPSSSSLFYEITPIVHPKTPAVNSYFLPATIAFFGWAYLQQKAKYKPYNQRSSTQPVPYGCFRFTVRKTFTYAIVTLHNCRVIFLKSLDRT